MRSVDRVIKEKLEVVARYRKGLNQQDNEESSEENEH